MEVIVDTREQNPFDLSIYGVEQISEKLDAGDYSLKNYPKGICIERKSSASELAINLGRHFQRFRNEMEILCDYDEAYIVCEFPKWRIENFPKYERIPKKLKRKIKVKPELLLGRIEIIEEEYDIPCLFFDDRESAEQITVNLMKEYVDKCSTY